MNISIFVETEVLMFLAKPAKPGPCQGSACKPELQGEGQLVKKL
jgi:hypothetical protein